MSTELKTFTFFAAGIPVPQPRPRLARRGRFTTVYNPSTANAWKASIKTAAIKAGMRRQKLEGPIKVRLFLYFPRPKAHYRTGKNAHLLRDDAPVKWHTNKPDLDNCEKAILDALTGIEAWMDDCQVCDLHTRKFYANADDVPGAYLTIRQLEDA
jgi:Holliday junction resolvase RusA-like endonuclease